MEYLFTDTSFLVAYYNANDVNHSTSRQFIKGLEGKKVKLAISDYIFDEILTVLMVRAGKDMAIYSCKKLYAEIQTGKIKWLCVNDAIFKESIEIFTKYKDKNWSFTDCTSYILMKKNGIKKCLSFDEHFKQFGYETLP